MLDLPLLGRVRATVGEASEYALSPFDTTEEAREVARLSVPRSRFCATADDSAELRSLTRLCATEAASSSSSVSGEARCLPFPLPWRDLRVG